ncbi:MAG: hypothetical protein IT370_12330 [Deltaproteobacteria bacterium]|nr:hypothetical protein [Deltaproteobacteria bacterium]
MTEREMENLDRKLIKRGFKVDGVRELCAACGERAQRIYRLVGGRIGGRDIHWCLACDVATSVLRDGSDALRKDDDFDLVKFLG